MFNLFNKKKSSDESTTSTVSLQPSCYVAINFEQLLKGIDNVRIDVHLSPRFTELGHQLISELLGERSSTKRRFTDKPSDVVLKKLYAFNASYASLLTATIHRAKEDKRLDLVQLLQIAVIKFVLTTVHSQAEQLLHQLRKDSVNENTKKLDLHERLLWINRHKNNLLYQVTYELFDQIHLVELSHVGKLRESLLGLAWSIPEEMLFNPLLQTPDMHNHQILMSHYVLLSQDQDSNYGFKRLKVLIDQLLDEVSNICHVQIEPKLEKQCVEHPILDDERMTSLIFSWKDVPDNMDILFKIQDSFEGLEDNSADATQVCQRQATKILEQRLRQTQVIRHLLAAYETPRLYEHYAKLLKPYLLYQALCDEIKIEEVAVKLQNQLKIRPLRRPGDKPLYITELKNTKKRLTKVARRPESRILRLFTTDFVTYQRDLKYYHLMQKAMDSVNLLHSEADLQLSQGNELLYEFFEQDEYNTNNSETIRNHVILKADLRGSTTITDELCQRGLNPATHFSRNFFNPIRKLIKSFGAEKVFIEGDAVILSFFEYQDSPEQWLATARACGLAKNMLAVVHKQNEISRANDLPQLELGIGISYSPAAPKFLYDGDQKIMISPAIGRADRLSSCSWKLRRKYSQQSNLLTHVMVFQQPPNDAFKGEKGMTTFRYNLNGIELESTAFKKLQNELALRQFTIRLPNDNYPTRFHKGRYLDSFGETHEVVIREGRVKVWREESEDYSLTKTLYYEVVTNHTILKAIKKRGL
ncbi:MAG TPA: hypothetical protein EYP59_15790 [Thiotrichaceae bacterium]|nr:hypothetical protein [Thiotrichaceae bacterium]